MSELDELQVRVTEIEVAEVIEAMRGCLNAPAIMIVRRMAFELTQRRGCDIEPPVERVE